MKPITTQKAQKKHSVRVRVYVHRSTHRYNQPCKSLFINKYIWVFLSLSLFDISSLSACRWQKWKRAETQSSWWSRAEGAERGSDQGTGLLLILTALPHGHANAAAASGLPSSVQCAQFMQFSGDEWVRLLCMCCKGKTINYSYNTNRAKRTTAPRHQSSGVLRELQAYCSSTGLY